MPGQLQLASSAEAAFDQEHPHALAFDQRSPFVLLALDVGTVRWTFDRDRRLDVRPISGLSELLGLEAHQPISWAFGVRQVTNAGVRRVGTAGIGCSHA